MSSFSFVAHRQTLTNVKMFSVTFFTSHAIYAVHEYIYIGIEAEAKPKKPKQMT